MDMQLRRRLDRGKPNYGDVEDESPGVRQRRHWRQIFESHTRDNLRSRFREVYDESQLPSPSEFDTKKFDHRFSLAALRTLAKRSLDHWLATQK